MNTKKITIEDIKIRENAWKIVLPMEYVEYLLTENGGMPAKKYFVCGNDICVIERYFGIISTDDTEENRMYDIDVVLTQVEERIIEDGEKIGYDIIPIAALFGGDLLCYDYRENREMPELCVWDHEASDELEPVTYYVCENWKELQNMVK